MYHKVKCGIDSFDAVSNFNRFLFLTTKYALCLREYFVEAAFTKQLNFMLQQIPTHARIANFSSRNVKYYYFMENKICELKKRQNSRNRQNVEVFFFIINIVCVY